MTSEMTEESAQRPVLNVVSTVRSAASPQLKWQIQNFGLFLTSKAKSLQQQFGPMSDIQFELTLSKRQSARNEEDKLELAIRSCTQHPNVKDFTAQLKGRIWLNNEADWASEFVLNFNDATKHFFATPACSFNSASILTIGDMIFEQIVVDTEVLGSWVMRLDDSCIMSRSVIEQNQAHEFKEWDTLQKEEESVSSTSFNMEVLEPELTSRLDQLLHFKNESVELDLFLETPKNLQTSTPTEKLEVSSNEAEPSESLEVMSASSEFNDTFPETPVNVNSGETNTTPLTLQSLQQINQQVDSLLEHLRSRSPMNITYQKKYKNLDDDWLKSLDELIAQKTSDYDFGAIKEEISDLKHAYKDLYAKLRKQFQLFGSDFLLFEFPSVEEKQNLDELHILIDYFEAVLKKLAKYQTDFDEFSSLDGEYWPLDEFPDCSQEMKWLVDYNKIRGTSEDEMFLAQEIRTHSNQAAKLERIQQELNQLWAGYARFSTDISNNKLKWFKEAEFLMERMRADISECETQSLDLFIRPMSKEEFGEMRCKLAQLESNVIAMLKQMEEDDSIEPYFIGLDLSDLEEKIKLLRHNLNLPTAPSFASQHLEKIKEKIKDLDKRVMKPSQRLQLDSTKDNYDDLCVRIAHLKVQNNAPVTRFNKIIESINQLHSNVSYTMENADSATLINYEVELCKCLSELESAVAEIESESQPVAPFWRQHYDAAKWKTDWLAQRLRERLEPWRQFMDLYTTIEQSHTAVGELVSELGSKLDVGYDETCQDIELLESMNSSFETTRKDISYIRRLCSAGQMKSAGLAAEAARRLKRINEAHRLVETTLRTLIFKLKAKTANPFYGRGRRGHRRRHNGGSSYDPFY